MSDATDREVAATAYEAAEETVFSRLDRSSVSDIDITVSFDGETLEVDVYLTGEGDTDVVAEDATLAARAAADDLLE